MRNFGRRLVEATIVPAIRRALEKAGITAERQLRDAQPVIRQELMTLRDRMARDTPGNPCIHGYKVYSQVDEDGIFEYIFGQIPQNSRTFIEIGCGRGVENNTHYLALGGWRGCWVDGSDNNIGLIQKELGGLKFKNLLVEKHFVSTENVGQILTSYCDFLGTNEPALFSLDIDGNDLYVMAKAVQAFQPMVICAEYNPKFPPPFAVTIAYNSAHTWRGGDYHGASLQAFCDVLTGYKLVCCNLTGANAFFVRNDLAGSFPDFTPRQLYQPFRENLIDLRSEHYPTLRWLRDRLNADGGPSVG